MIRTHFKSCRPLSVVAGCCLAIAGMVMPVHAQTPVVAVSRNGSVFSLPTDITSIAWRTLDDSPAASAGESNRVAWKDIRSVRLSSSNVSKQMEEVAGWIEQLDAANYHDRESAEQNLRSSVSMSIFRGLIDSKKNHPSLELRHRLNRLLRDYEKNGSQIQPGSPPEEYYDLLVLKNGSKRRGDASGLKLQSRWKDQPISLSGSQLNVLYHSDTWSTLRTANTLPPRAPVTTKLLIAESKEEPWQQAQMLNFEINSFDVNLEGYVAVDDAYINDGVRFFSDDKFKLIISGFKFSFDSPPRENSICVFDSNAGYTKRFEGVTRMEFCLPGAAQYSAGVHRIGFYAARVDHAKDFVMKAFDANGLLLGMVEASGDPCPYFAVESSVPIAYVEFLNNPYFVATQWEKDTRYAIDDLRFSQPQPVYGLLNRSGQDRVFLKNGELLCATELQFSSEPLLTMRVPELADPVSIPSQEIEAIVRSNSNFRKPKPGGNGWFALLDDGSMLTIQPGPAPTAEALQGWKLPWDRVMAVWSERDHLRIPLAEDFVDGQTLLMFPSCRIALPKVDWETDRLVWSMDQGVVSEPKFVDELPVAATTEQADSLPRFSEFEYAGSQKTQSPSIWLRQPMDLSDVPGITTRSGERYATGGAALFAVEEINEDGVRLQGPEGKVIELKHADIQRIRY